MAATTWTPAERPKTSCHAASVGSPPPPLPPPPPPPRMAPATVGPTMAAMFAMVFVVPRRRY
jgi:hypothetical protein